MNRRTVLVGVVLLILASCGDSDTAGNNPFGAMTTAADAGATSTTAAPTTSAATATTVAASTTVATTAVPTTVAPTLPYPIAYDGMGLPMFPPVLGSPGDPNGSGCAPPGDVLPDGIWFGYAEAVSGGVITFDLACYFTGDAAWTASLAGDCDTEFGDYCVRNNNPKVFSVPIAATAEVFYIEAGTWDLAPVPASSWPVSPSYLTCPGEKCGVWLYVNGGSATGIVEMFEE